MTEMVARWFRAHRGAEAGKGWPPLMLNLCLRVPLGATGIARLN